jgi:hypothetical protein
VVISILHQHSSVVISMHQCTAMEASGHQWSSSHHMITWWQSLAIRRNHRDHIARAHIRHEELIGGNQWQSVAISVNQWQSVAISGNHREHIARAHVRHEELIGRVRDERATWMERAHAALGTARVPDCHVGSGAADELHHD